MNLRKKISLTCIGLVLLVAATVGIVVIVQMNVLHGDVMQSNDTFTETAGEMSAASMTTQIRLRMVELARGNAALANTKFESLEEQVAMLADQAKKLYENPEGYGARMVDEPDAANDGELSVQLLHSKKVKNLDAPRVQKEIGLLGNLSDTLYEVNNHFENMASDYVAMESGLMIQADYISGSKFAEDGSVLPYEADERPWYAGAKETQAPYFTPVSRDAHTEGIGIMCGVPIYVDDAFAGVAGAGMYLEDIERLVTDIKLGKEGYACIVNRNGQVIFSPRESGELMVDVENQTDLRESDNWELRSLVHTALFGGSSIAKVNLDGESCYIASAPMDKVGWAFLVVLKEEEVVAPTLELQDQLRIQAAHTEKDMQHTIHVSLLTIVLLLLFFCALVLGVSIVLSAHIVKPIQMLTDRVSLIDGDNLDFTWEYENHDETAVLASAFLGMTQKMKQYIQNITEITAEKERIGAELNVATKIQADMLPKIFPAFPGRSEFDIFAKMDPAKEVGGDFYDFFLVDDDHLAIVIADVSSKGVPAALFMVIAKTLIKNHAQNHCQSLGELFSRVNTQLCEGNDEGMFVTSWMGLLTISTGALEFVNAGHNPQLVMYEDRYEWIQSQSGFVLAGLEGIPYTSEYLQLKHGSRIFLYTDGVTEAQNEKNELFGEERLLESLAKNGKLPLPQMLSDVRADIDVFVGAAEQFDDITMLGLIYK